MSFKKICKDIKTLRIQGAENVARAAVKAMMIKNSPYELLSLRKTEPCMYNTIKFIKEDPKKLGEIALKHFDDSKNKIIKLGAKKIKNGYKIYTHCHSSTVINILKEAKKQGKKFTVYNTETRPLFQGRITANELSKLRIKCVHMVDSAARVALKQADSMLIGCDAITKDRIYNKIGSEMISVVANKYKVPVYVCTNSWKFDARTLRGYELEIEERSDSEVWKNPPKGVEISNFAFEKIEPELIKGVISELGVLKHKQFIKKVIKKYPWML